MSFRDPLKKPKPFKFFNFLTYKPGVLDVVREGLSNDIQGTNMFKVVKRLKGLKSSFRELLKDKVIFIPVLISCMWN